MENNNKKFNLSNLVTTSLLTGLLVIGAALYMENKKRTAVEENLLAVVNDLVVWHKQRTELADANAKVVKYLNGFHGVSLRAAELGILFADKEFRERIKNDVKINSALLVAIKFSMDNSIREEVAKLELGDTAQEKMTNKFNNFTQQLEEQFNKESAKTEEQ